MEVILIVILLVAGVSLYDYLSSKNWQQVTSDQRSELVFEERNREYGAYQIRKNYSMNLILILCSVVFVIGSAFGIYKVVSKPEEMVKKSELNTDAFAMDTKFEEEDIVEPLDEPIPEVEKTLQFLPPVVTDDEVDTPPAVVEEVTETTVSTNTQDGSEGFGVVAPPTKKDPPIEVEKPKVYDFVDESAEYPGGMAEMRKYLAENIKYPQTAVEMGYEGKTYLKFIVSENGNISNVKVVKGVTDCPECDAEATRVVKNMPKWTPGKVNGKAVNSTFSIPVVFKLN